VDYKLNKEFKAYMRKHMALSCLPADQMVPVFNLLKQEVNNINPLPLRKAIRCWHKTYFDRYWFRQVGPETLSTFGLAHKTNNVCEALHKK